MTKVRSKSKVQLRLPPQTINQVTYRVVPNVFKTQRLIIFNFYIVFIIFLKASTKKKKENKGKATRSVAPLWQIKSKL